MSFSDYGAEKIGRPLVGPLDKIADAMKQANRIKAAEILLESGRADMQAKNNALRFLSSIV